MSNCSVLVSREHGGPEGMDPDGVIEVRNGQIDGGMDGGISY